MALDLYCYVGEWCGGAPPRSLRTGLEPLSSSGSHYPAVGYNVFPTGWGDSRAFGALHISSPP